MARDGQPPRPHPTEKTVGSAFFLRVVVLASVAVIGSGWALVRFYTHPHAPMLVPAPTPSDAGTAARTRDGDWGDAAVIPAPEVELAPR